MPSVPESFQKKSARVAEIAKAQKAKAASDAAAEKEFIKGEYQNTNIPFIYTFFKKDIILIMSFSNLIFLWTKLYLC